MPGAVMSSDSATAELITDAIAGAGLPDGTYELMRRAVTVADGHATLAGGTIAGSTATMDQCVRNVHRQVNVPLAEAVKMASYNPARVMGLTSRIGSLAVGKDANLAVIDEDVNVHLTMVKGKVVFSKL